MRVNPNSRQITIFENEVIDRCKLGKGADTCVWLAVEGKGFECLYWNRPLLLSENWKAGLTVAKRDGCEEVRSLFEEVK